MKKIILLLILFVGNGVFAQSAGFNNTFIIFSINGNGNLYYDLNGNTSNYDFNNATIGTFCQGSANGMVFKGAEHNIYKCGGCDLTSTRLYYRIYLTGTTPGNFVSNTIGYTSGFNNGCGGQDQMWSNVGYNTNLLAGLGAGNYTIEVYSDASVTCSGGMVYASNSGANYKAYFTVSATSVGGSVSGSQSVCSGSTPTDLTLSGHTGSVTKWQRSTSSDFTSGVTDISNTTTTLTGTSIGALTATTYFRAVVTSGLCSSANSYVATITVNAQSAGGTVSGNHTLCSGSTPTDLTLSGHTGSVTKWQRSTSSDFTSGVTDISNTSTTLTGASVGALTATTYFRAVVTSGACSSANSSVATITVNAPSAGGTVSGSQTICSGSTPTDLTLSGHTGSVTKWQRSTSSDFTSGVTDISNTSTTLTGASVGALTATTYFRAVVTSGVCSSANSTVATITVNPASAGGSISGNQTLCSGSIPTDLTLSGHTGSVTKWQRSTSSDFTSGVTDISNTTTTLTGTSIGALTATTYFRAVVTSGVCSSANSTVATITVNAQSAGGTVSGNHTLCSGSTPTDLTLSGHTGSVTKWQRSTSSDFTSGVTDISNTTTTLTGASVGALTATTYFRAVVTSGVCSSANSTVATITVNPASAGGTLSGNQALCSGSTPADLTLSGHTGSVTKWQRSTSSDFTSGVTDISNTTTTLTGASVGALTATTYFRAVVTSGVCSSANSTVATITVNAQSAGGTLSGNQTLCSGSIPTDLTLSGHTGSVTKWQRSTSSDFTSGVTDISNTTTTLTGTSIGALTATTYFRAVVTSGVCSSANSTVATITVNAPSAGGVVSGNYEFCTTDNSGTLTLSGHTGSIVKWQSSTVSDFSVAVSDITNTNNTLNFTDVTQTTYYRAIVKSGNCPEAASASVGVIINNNMWNGAAGNSDWNDAGNWSCGEVPTEFENAVIAAGSGQPDIAGNNTVSAASLTILDGADVVVRSGSNLIVTNEVVVEEGGSLTIENNANLIQVNDVDNTGAVTVNKNSAPLYRLDYEMWSSPVAGETLAGFSPETLSNRFYLYNPLSDQYATVSGETPFAEGAGYLIRVANTHPAFVNAQTPGTSWHGTFVGTPNNGNVDVAVTPQGSGVQGYNAVGNPYPSPINIHAFYAANTSTIADASALYFWRKKNDAATGSYARVTKLAYTANTGNAWGDAGGTAFNGAPNTWVINPGQGFIVQATGSTVHFNNAMRVPVNNGQIFRTAQDESEVAVSRLWLNLSGQDGFSQAAIGYTDMTTLGLDYGWDGKAFINDGDVTLFSLAGEELLGIQARPSFEASDVVPMGYNATQAGNYTIALDHMDGVFESGQGIYLQDNLLNITHDLNQGAYEFTTEAGVITGRFNIIYAQPLSTENPVLDANSVIVYKDGSSISINSGTTDMTSVSVYDTRGRLLYSAKDINATTTVINGLQADKQVLIVNIATLKGDITKKIIF